MAELEFLGVEENLAEVETFCDGPFTGAFVGVSPGGDKILVSTPARTYEVEPGEILVQGTYRNAPCIYLKSILEGLTRG